MADGVDPKPRNEIEITPEMIEAAEQYFADRWDCEFPTAWTPEFFAGIYRAMTLAR